MDKLNFQALTWGAFRAAAGVIFLAGCAADPVKHAARLASPVLCYVNWAGNETDKAVSSAELSRRGFVCTEEHVRMGEKGWQLEREQAAIAKAQRREAIRDLSIHLLTQPPPAPLQLPPRAVHCYTSPQGYTTCY